NLVGVVALAPFWVSNLAWAALTTPGTGYTTSNASYMLQYQLDYFYSHGELLDGPGHGLDLIAPAKRDAVKALVTGKCLDDVATNLKTLGAEASDYFDPAASNALGPRGFTRDCSTPPAPLWKDGCLADRPPIATSGAPIVLWFGGMDKTVTPGLARCAMDKLGRDMLVGGSTQVTSCSDPDAVHLTVPPRDVAWVNDWIA